MTFGEAIQAMKDGACVSRAGWNGKGMFLFVTTPKVGTPPGVSEPLPIVPSVCMKTAQDTVVVGWLASQTDMLADDWREVV